MMECRGRVTNKVLTQFNHSKLTSSKVAWDLMAWKQSVQPRKILCVHSGVHFSNWTFWLQKLRCFSEHLFTQCKMHCTSVNADFTSMNTYQLFHVSPGRNLFFSLPPLPVALLIVFFSAYVFITIKAKAIYCLSLQLALQAFCPCFMVDIQPNKMRIQFTRCIRHSIAQWLPAAQRSIEYTSLISQIAVHSRVKILSIFRYFSFLHSFFIIFFTFAKMIMSSENNFIAQNEDQAPKQIIFWLSSFDNGTCNGYKWYRVSHCNFSSTQCKMN